MSKQSVWKQPVKPLIGWLILVLAVVVVTSKLCFFSWKDGKLFDYGKKAGLVADLTGQGDLGQGGAPAEEESPLPAYDDLPFTDEGVTWLDAFQDLGDLGLIAIPNLTAEQKRRDEIDTYHGVTYQKVGEDNGKAIIQAQLKLTYANPNGTVTEVYHFLKESEDIYALLSTYSEPRIDGEFYSRVTFDRKVSREVEKKYNALTLRRTLNVNGSEVIANSWWDHEPGSVYTAEAGSSALHDDKVRVTELAKLPIGTVYRHAFPQALGYDIETIVLKRLNGTAIIYEVPVDFIKDDYTAKITWSDGTKHSGGYRLDGIPTGCGHPYGTAILPNISSDELIEMGKASSGETIYGFKSTDNAIVKAAYDNYASFYKDAKERISSDPKLYNTDYDKKIAATKILTAEELRTKGGVVVFKDVIGRYVFLTSTDYSAQVECGKPVIYLYPEKSTKVSVKVGANVTVSEPIYGNGWTVQAEPTGKLRINGKTYDSLFWEGLGHGRYPAITEGFVVARADAERTIGEHLTELGLNAKESSDFMEFWAHRLPKTPYVRLTWFGTRQLDELAPLTVRPKPDTSIRIFLDFEGLAQPISLKPQQLSAVPREGFTLVEWGGLLH